MGSSPTEPSRKPLRVSWGTLKTILKPRIESDSWGAVPVQGTPPIPPSRTVICCGEIPAKQQPSCSHVESCLAGGRGTSQSYPHPRCPPAVPDCTGKALESARVISPEIGGWAPGCPLSSCYQPYSVTQTHCSGAKFDLLHEVLRGSPWSLEECEASSWPDDPPCISASFPTSPVHFRTPLLLPASLLGSMRLCCPFCLGPPA